MFGLLTPVGDLRLALLCDAFLFLPAMAVALAMPDPADGATTAGTNGSA